VNSKIKIDFIGVGAQKSATSWIYDQLSYSNKICIPVKELHFFSRERYQAKGVGWYESQFDCCSDRIKGEFSTSYLYNKDVAKRIYINYPEAKIIVSLRDPVKRAFSNYLNDIMAGNISKNESFNDAINARSEYIDQGYYYDQICEYLNYFSKDRIHIILFEDIRDDPQVVVRDLFEFLCVPMIDISDENISTKKNESRIPVNVELEKLMYNVAQMLNRKNSRWLYSVIKATGLHGLIRKINTSSTIPKLSLQNYLDLRVMYESDIDKLQQEFKLDLSKWKF